MKIFKKAIVPLLLFVLVIPTFARLIRSGYFPIQDDQQAFRLLEMDKCFQDFQIPCRWVPDAGYGYGYPQFEYYGPSVYYLGEVIHRLGFQFIDSIKILFALGYIVGAFGMFLLLKEYLGKYPALVGALLYTYAPYKADEVYVRGDMNEFWSLALFPFIFWAFLKLIKKESWRWVGVSGFFVGMLLLTHNLMSLIFLPIAGIWVMVLMVLEKNWSLFPKIVLGFLLGLAVAASFTLPVLTEQKDAHLETLLGGYFGFEQHFVSIKQLFLSNYWGYGSSVLGPYDDLSLSTGIIQWVSAAFGIFLSIVSFKKYRKISISVFVLGVIELFILLMMHPRSIVIWNKLPFLAFLQFPWRFLGDSTFLLSFMGAVGVFLLTRLEGRVLKNAGVICGGVFILAAVILNVYFFQPKTWLQMTDQEKFSGMNWQRELTSSIFDYLPIYATLPPIHPAPPIPEILGGQGSVVIYEKGSDFQIGEVELSKPAELRLPLFDFPGMMVWVDGVGIPHGHSNCSGEPFCLGLISFQVPSGTHSIEARLTNTPIRIIGDWASATGLFVVLILVIDPLNYRKRQAKK